MSPKPHLCAAGVKLRDQINATWPNRDKASDGWLGDAAHAARKSDHNPDEHGVVRAIDIDEDLLGAAHQDPQIANDLAAQLVLAAKTGEDRIAYVIFEGKFYSPRTKWQAEAYTGPNAHNHHIHVSFTTAGDADGAPFHLPLLTGLTVPAVVAPVKKAAPTKKAPAKKAAPVKAQPSVSLANLAPRGEHDDVAVVQDALRQSGLYKGKVDGIYGPQTKAAYQAWQRSLGFRGTAADGVMAMRSLTALGAKFGFRATK